MIQHAQIRDALSRQIDSLKATLRLAHDELRFLRDEVWPEDHVQAADWMEGRISLSEYLETQDRIDGVIARVKAAVG